jgi:hypothetical protein
MKKIFMCLVAFAAISAFAAEEKLPWNSTDKAVIKTYVDKLAAGQVPEGKLPYWRRSLPVIEALATVNGDVSYAEFKAKVYDALTNVPELKDKKINIIGTVLLNTKRFRTPALCQRICK